MVMKELHEGPLGGHFTTEITQRKILDAGQGSNKVYTISISVWITSIAGENQRENTLVRILTSLVSKLEKLQEARM